MAFFDITFRDDLRPEIEAVARLCQRAGLRCPLDDLERLRQTYAASNVILSAWYGEHLVGILRGWMDGAWDGYLCDLAVDPVFQKAGIGRELVRRALAINPQVQWVLRASDEAAAYYEHLGWQRIPNGWFHPRQL